MNFSLIKKALKNLKGYYLEGIDHKLISEDEIIIIAEKKWDYILFNKIKKIEYVCKIESDQYYITFKYFKDGKPADNYAIFYLDWYTFKIEKELGNKKNIKRVIRKLKLDKINEKN